MKWLLLFAALLLLPPAAHAVLPSAHAATTDPRIKIAIIDTGIRHSAAIEQYLCTDGHKDFTGEGLYDRNGHGTNIAHLIASHISPATHCLLIYKYCSSSSSYTIDPTVLAFNEAVKAKARFINYSSGGTDPDAHEYRALELALKAGIVVAVAASNDGADLGKKCFIYPACYKFRTRYKNFYVVENGTRDKPYMMSNYGGPVNAWQDGRNQNGGGIVMSGSSQATAIQTGILAGTK